MKNTLLTLEPSAATENDFRDLQDLANSTVDLLTNLIEALPDLERFRSILNEQEGAWQVTHVEYCGVECLQLEISGLRDHARRICIYSTNILSAIEVFHTYWSQHNSHVSVNAPGGVA